MRWSLQAVEKAAPDASSLAAGRRLSTPAPWSGTGCTDTLVWGRCQGSGAAPYQVSVDLAGPAYRCSCPSRKFPCKHAIALLLLWVRDPMAFATGDPADFVQDWAARRAERAAGQSQRDADAARTAAGPKDPAAAARRREQRLALMDGGMADLGLWLGDLVRAGLVTARRQPLSWWDQTAARLVDAQLPGLAEEVRDVASEVNRRPDWADHLLDAVGRWWTAVQAWQTYADLDDRTRADLRVLVGWATPSEEVRTAADTVQDDWLVLGAHRSDDGRLQQQRTWLQGRRSGETVLLLDFAVRQQPLPVARLTGSVLEATVARYPGSPPQRVLLLDEPQPRPDAADALPGGTDLAAASAELAALWAGNPFTRRAPVVLDEAVLVPPGRGEPAYVVDACGDGLPLLLDEVSWSLFARAGGRPCRVFGELEAAGFRPLTLDLDLTPGAER